MASDRARGWLKLLYRVEYDPELIDLDEDVCVAYQASEDDREGLFFDRVLVDTTLDETPGSRFPSRARRLLICQVDNPNGRNLESTAVTIVGFDQKAAEPVYSSANLKVEILERALIDDEEAQRLRRTSL